jgi:hypothetical protein
MPIVGSFAGASARAYGLGAGLALPGDFESIATVTVGSGGAANVEFTSIPASFTHLQIRGIIRRTSGSYDVDTFQFNGDTGTNYSWHNLYADSTSVGANQGANFTSCYGLVTLATTSGANIFGAVIVDILDYANTNKYKTSRGMAGIEDNSTGYPWNHSSNWRNTNAITSIKFTPAAGNYAQYTSFALYGVKA